MVRDLSVEFGDGAGKIWVTLSQNGVLRKDDLISFAKLNDEEFQAGVGWLARENKIYMVDDGSFKLGFTNLTNEIGSQAGRLWRILDIWGEADFVSLRRLSDLSEAYVYRALGWLAKEGKIFVSDDDKFCLK